MSRIVIGDKYLIARDILVGDSIAFSKGEQVIAETAVGSEDGSHDRYAVLSKSLSKRFLLSEADLVEFSEGDSSANTSECIHVYERSSSGSVRCSKCGSEIAKPGIPNNRTEQACSECGAAVTSNQVVCGNCGAPIIEGIKAAASLRGPGQKRCMHDFRYVENGKICIRCGVVTPLKTVAERRKYASALHKEICVNCGAEKLEGRDFCVHCGRGYETITPVSPDQKVYNPRAIRTPQRSTVARGYPEGQSAPSEGATLQSPQGPFTAPNLVTGPAMVTPVGLVQTVPVVVGPVVRNDGMCIASMVLGICSIVFYVGGTIPGILAIVFAVIGKRKLLEDSLRKGNGMATAGLVCGIIGVALSLFWIIVLLSATSPYYY